MELHGTEQLRPLITDPLFDKCYITSSRQSKREEIRCQKGVWRRNPHSSRQRREMCNRNVT